MFKVGDRVRVDTPEADFMCREESYLGDFGTVVRAYQEGCDVKIERDGEEWAFSNAELALVEAAIVPTEAPTLRDQFAMAALTGFCGHSDISMDAIFDDAESRARTAIAAYAAADAMLTERERAK